MATELAKAYVQIIPSAQGIKGAITQELGGEAEHSGKLFGGKLTSTIKNAIAMAGIGATLGKAITEGANLQQSLGGIDTLFKNSALTVKQYANQAYATAGISANKYMEQVTSFSAQLLQSLGGDTAKSAEVANMAIIDMADNSNKMGTSIEMIQNAYQGFARGSYVMLDNLKLGYGGTRAEMERLLSDAQKLTGVKYDINNLSDVYNAIHAIQGELGITGTTAKEASTTLIGSFGAMSAAFSNLLGNMALGNGITASLQQVFSTFGTFFAGNLLPLIGNVISSIPTIILQGVPMIASAGVQLFTSLANSVKTQGGQIANGFLDVISNIGAMLGRQAPAFISAGMGLLLSLSEGFASNFPALSARVLEMILNVGQWLAQQAPALIQSGFEMLQNLVSGFVSALPTFIEQIPIIVTTFANIINDNAPTILMNGVQLVWQLIQGIISAIPTLVANVPQIIQAIWATIQAVNWWNLGSNIIQGFSKGITGAIGWVKTASKSVLDSVNSFFAQLPSKLMTLGQQAIQHMSQGFTSMVGTIGQSASTIVQTIITFIQQLPGKLFELAVQAGTKIAEALGSKIDEITGKAGEIKDGIMKKIGEIVGEVWQIGADFVHGLWDGISGTAGWLWEQISGFCSDIVENVKGFFHIGSPSKLMRDEVGRWLPEGMAVGINANADSVDSAMRSLQDEAMGVFDTSSRMATQKYVFESEDTQLLSIVESIINDLRAQGYTLSRLYELLAELLPNFENLQLVTDTGALVGELAEQMDEKLGTFNRRKER